MSMGHEGVAQNRVWSVELRLWQNSGEEEPTGIFRGL